MTLQTVGRAWAFGAASGKTRLIIGTDCPDLTEAHLRTAFVMLEDSDIVLGPAQDGGYYLIGLREPQPLLFEAIPWSTGEVFALREPIALQLILAGHAPGLSPHRLARMR